jgi:signal transduction histidine kinase
VEIAVVDSGPGIPTEMQNRLWEPFFTSKEVGKGTGLGLAVSRRLVEKHAGRLFIDAKSPNTRFVIELPKTRYKK